MPSESDYNNLITQASFPTGPTHPERFASSLLKFTAAGNRRADINDITGEGVHGNYGIGPKIDLQVGNRLHFSSFQTVFAGDYRSYGYTIRCVQN